MCSTTLFQGPLQYTSHSIFMAYYRSIPLEVSMAKPFLGSAVQEMKPNRSNLNCHLTFPPTKSHSKLGRFAEGKTNRYFYDVRQSEMSHWTVLWWLGTYCHCSCQSFSNWVAPPWNNCWPATGRKPGRKFACMQSDVLLHCCSQTRFSCLSLTHPVQGTPQEEVMCPYEELVQHVLCPVVLLVKRLQRMDAG